MPSETANDPETTNIERLRGHLEDGSLAAALVDAYQSSVPDARAAALQTIINARLEAIRTALAEEASSSAPD